MTAALRLQRALASHSAADVAALSDRIGIDRRIGARAKGGRKINASAYLALCCAVGINPVTGESRPVREPTGPVMFWFLGAGVTIARLSRKLSYRQIAKASGVTHPTIFRVERGLPVSAETVLRVAAFLGVRPEGFTACFTTNTNSTTSEAA